MKEKLFKQIRTFAAVALVVMLASSVRVYATSTTATYSLPKNTYVKVTSTKSTNTDSVSFRLLSVFPYGSYDEDTYTRIKISAYNGSNVLMSERVIYEGDSTTTYNYATIKNLSKGDSVSFNLRGNNPNLAAYATVYLNWK